MVDSCHRIACLNLIARELSHTHSPITHVSVCKVLPYPPSLSQEPIDEDSRKYEITYIRDFHDNMDRLDG